jgi:hypothetical protein
VTAPTPTRFAGPIPIAWDSRGQGEPALLMFGGWCAPRSLLGGLATLRGPRRRARPVLHLYAKPADPGFLEAQSAFSRKNGWYSFRRLEAKSRFPMLEVPETMAAATEEFAG